MMTSVKLRQYRNKNKTRNKHFKQDNQCCVCLKYFKNGIFLENHAIKHKQLYHKCDTCNSLRESMLDFRKHLTEHLKGRAKELICNVCYGHFETKSNITRHMKQQHHVPTNKYPDKLFCVICDLGFDDSSTLILHLKNDHKDDSMVIQSGINTRSGRPTHICRFCDIFCGNVRLREVHIITSHGEPPYECAICPKRFYTKAPYDLHLLQHTKTQYHKAGMYLQTKGLRLYKYHIKSECT